MPGISPSRHKALSDQTRRIVVQSVELSNLSTVLVLDLKVVGNNSISVGRQNRRSVNLITDAANEFRQSSLATLLVLRVHTPAATSYDGMVWQSVASRETS